jgi:hypothetical protein
LISWGSGWLVGDGDSDLLMLINQVMAKNVPVRLVRGASISTSQEYYALAAQPRTEATARALPVEESDFDLVLWSRVLGQPV